MSDSGGETVGLLLGGAAIVLVLLAWPARSAAEYAFVLPLVLVAAAATAVAFSAARHGRLEAKTTALVASGGGFVMLVGGIGRLGGAELHWLFPALLAIAGFGCLLVGGIEVGLVRSDRLPAQSRALFFATALGFGGLFVASAVASIPSMLSLAFGVEFSAMARFAIQQVGTGLGFVLATVGFLLWTERGIGYLDIERFDRRDVGYLVGGTVAVLAAASALAMLYAIIGVEVGEHSITRRGRQEGATLLLIAIPFAWLATALGEELLFRNGIQKYLTERFTPVAAILLSSVIFAAAHGFAYAAASPRAILAPLVVVFSLSLILAVAYERTRNVAVTIVIHGTYNALVYLQIYRELVT